MIWTQQRSEHEAAAPDNDRWGSGMRKWWPLVALATAQFVMVLDQSVMNVSIRSSEQRGWVHSCRGRGHGSGRPLDVTDLLAAASTNARRLPAPGPKYGADEAGVALKITFSSLIH